MPNHELTQFIIEELARNEGKQEITNKLLFKGWKIEQINEAFSLLKEESPIPQKPFATNTPPLVNAHVFTQTQDSSQQNEPAPNPQPSVQSNNPVTQIPNETNYLPGVKELFTQAWQLEKDRFKTITATILLPFILIIAGVGIGFIFIMSKQTILSSIFIITSMLLTIILSICSQIALILIIKNRDQQLNFKQAFLKSFSKLIPFIILSLLIGLISITGIILLIVPVFIFCIWFSFANFILIADDKSIIESLKLSKQYTNGKFFAVVYRFFGLSSITILISFVINLIPLVNLLGIFINLFILSPLTLIYNYLLYENLKRLNGKQISNQPSGIFKILITSLFLISISLILILLFYVVPNFIKNYSNKPTTFHYSNTFQNYKPLVTPIASPSSYLTPIIKNNVIPASISAKAKILIPTATINPSKATPIP